MNSRQRRKRRRLYERFAEQWRRMAERWLSKPIPKPDVEALDAHRGFLLPTELVLTFYRHKETQ